MKIFLIFLCLTFTISSQVKYDDYFFSKTLRFDYIHAGNDKDEEYIFDELIEEPHWGGSKINLVDIFEFGDYKFEVYDIITNTLIYSRGYSSLFAEWRTTEEAKEKKEEFFETVIFPFPKKPVRVEFFSRDRKNIFHKKFEYEIDPAATAIKVKDNHFYDVIEVHHSGDPSVNVDIVILPEGYSENEMDKFIEDAKKFSGYLFNSSPFKENKDKFNIRGVHAPSVDSGTTDPGDSLYKNTLLGTSYYSLGIERYLMTLENKTVRDVAANVPYDQIYILVNSEKYGGGAIYNYYSVCINNHRAEEYVFVHEFGHGFAALADEYYTSEVAYQDFYPLDVEPWEANLTTLVDFDSKWKDKVNIDTPIPTPATEEFKNTLGVFEGGGYVEKGVYRPAYDCSMKSATVNNFCTVCSGTINKMIKFYSE